MIAVAARPDASTVSAPASVLIASVSLAGSALVTLTAAARPVTFAVPLPPATVTASLPVGAVDDHAVGLAVAARRRWPRGRRNLADIRAGQVVDRDGVGAAERVEVDLLDAVGVHRDVADVAEEPQPGAVGGQVDVLVDVRAVEEHRVVAVLALDDVAAVARIPGERVVAGAEEGDVRAAVAVDRVVAVAAEERVRPRPPTIVSLPAPPLTVSLIALAASPEASMVSSPPSALIVSVSFAGSAPATLTVAARPVTAADRCYR